MRHRRRSHSPVHALSLATVVGLTSVLVVWTACGCTPSGPRFGTPPAAPLQRELPKPDTDRFRQLGAERDAAIERLLDQRMPAAIERASELAAARTADEVNGRLADWFAEVGIEDVDVRERIRTAVEERLPAIVRTEAEVAARRATDELAQAVDQDRQRLMSIEHGQRTILERISAGAEATASVARWIPGWGGPIAGVLGVVASIAAWFGGRRQKDGELRRRTNPTKEA